MDNNLMLTFQSKNVFNFLKIFSISLRNWFQFRFQWTSNNSWRIWFLHLGNFLRYFFLLGSFYQNCIIIINCKSFRVVSSIFITLTLMVSIYGCILKFTGSNKRNDSNIVNNNMINENLQKNRQIVKCLTPPNTLEWV